MDLLRQHLHHLLFLVVLFPVLWKTLLHLRLVHGQGQLGASFKFSFETGAVTMSDTDWDIAFRGTTLL